jgi:predicted MFS family arabinose efflux permease
MEGGPRVRLRDVFASSGFRALWLAQAQSRLGDQLARVAVALLVFDRTGSAALTTLVYALTYLPPLLTAPLLAALADRYPRRSVMVAVELLRAVLVAVMAIPAVPLPVLAALLVGVACPQPLFSAARNAVLPAVLPDDRFPLGMSVINTTDYLAQIAGFTSGGLVVESLGGPRVALAIDAVTFLLSALLVWFGIDAYQAASGSVGRPMRFALAGLVLLGRDRRLLTLAGLMWLYGLYLAPTALAAPYAHQVGAGTTAVGVLMAGDLPGAVIGAMVVVRFRPALQPRLILPLAAATGVPLLAGVFAPPVPAAVALWACSGVVSSYLVLAQVRFTRLVPDELRGRAIGVASAGLQTAQGLGVLVSGAVAELVAPSTAIAVCGAGGCAGALLIGFAGRAATNAPPQKADTDAAEAVGEPEHHH